MYRAKAKFTGSEQVDDIRINFIDEVKWNGKTYKKNTLSFQAPVSGTIYGTLFNFRDQQKAMKEKFHEMPYNEPPIRPVLYIKPRNTINSHQHPIPVPSGKSGVEVNATIGVIIGRNATHLTKQDALSYVDGYTVVNDVSTAHDSFFRPAIKNKARDGFCSVGPWIIAREEVPDLNQLMIRTFCNGDLVHVSNTKNLVRSIPQLLAEVTEFMTLYKGDMLLIGIPNNAPIASPGDTVKIVIDQIGTLVNPIIEESTIKPGGAL
ncbi:fumarylacetoacetate hydrolase family protein [Virgibacillus sp. C22-A2]|uniref:Fumarylacetoacetate hydrolase family protein n=1 Tax=Virgibacillus tibetensis TaxID=3042313 RepID=A0ABU6KCW7_9BACI|nr:fumarylacetoacetate hydrolase family protein [Virgibacillus sp. C22-A2]